MSVSHTNLAISAQGLTARPARRADLPQVARLLTQLYAAEIPGALSGSPADQTRLLQFTLEAKGGQGLRRRYVLADAADTVYATAALGLPGDPPYERAPAGTLRRAMATIGPLHTVQLLLVVARSLIAVHHSQPADAALVHSVIVDERGRGRGLGMAIMDAIEGEIRSAGLSVATLQVLQANTPAQRLYQRRGYEIFWASPTYLRALAWPTYLMRKAL